MAKDTEIMQEKIEKRIFYLNNEKEETLNDYRQASNEWESAVLAERNARISMELKFLNSLLFLPNPPKQ